MAINDFKAFAIGNGANVMSQADYEALSALASGFLSGKASSAQVNKAIRQSSTIAAVLAQFMADSTGSDVLDNGDTALLLNILKSALNNQAEGRLLRIQVFTASGSWTKTAGTKQVRIKAWGAGGGGKGTDVAGTGAPSGAGGAYVEGLYDVSTINGANIVIGAGGAAVAAGSAGNGGDGGDTTITALGISAGGGKGGNSAGNSAGGIPGAPSVGTIFSVAGQGGQGGTGVSLGGVGGASHSSYGGLPHVSSSGDDGFFPGGGGAGASYDSIARASGKGANGYVIIEEYA
ncbi:glycine-rich domain-containing protein [Klebsiella aerogenes]|uniref:glycine-rich domain-containing protein n=1 Tax=Klebsiella aerogenes TaxID=548 RepID=UPI00063CCA16|nr:hypothetical protein [Klebsiella aerogenes]KLE93577.1 hypothetical protein YA24_19770 [Klebsiella aerogenes]